MEYDHWVTLGQDLPEELRQIDGVNTEDEHQVAELLVPLFSRNKGAVDFYLSQVVFPQADVGSLYGNSLAARGKTT